MAGNFPLKWFLAWARKESSRYAWNAELKRRFPQASISGAARIDRQAELQLGKGARIDDVMIAGAVSIGRGSFVNGPSWIMGTSEAPVQIGNFCSIAPRVSILSMNHPTTLPSTFKTRNGPYAAIFRDIPSPANAITIGSDVWVCSQSLVLGGVNIGNGAVVAAGSVVTKDVPEYTVAAGAPAKPLKTRFSGSVINLLGQLRWWEWTDERIEQNRQFFNTDLAALGEDDLERLMERL